MDIVTYALAKKMVDGVASGVSSVDVNNTNHTLTFHWVAGGQSVMTFPVPADGVSVTDVDINSSGHLICTMSDGSTIDAGLIPTSLAADLTPNVTIGGITAGQTIPAGTSIETVLRKLLITYQMPGITIALTPSKVVYDVVTETITSIKLTAAVTKKSKEITSVKFKAGGTLIHEETTGIEEGGSFEFTYTPATPINSTITFRVECSDEDNTVGADKEVKFVAKSYWGTVDGTVTAPVESDIKGLDNSELKTAKGLTYSDVIMTNGKIVYAYPKSFGLLTSIVDKMGNDYMGSYTRTEVNVDSIAYYVYTLTDPSTIESAGYKQIFA